MYTTHERKQKVEVGQIVLNSQLLCFMRLFLFLNCVSSKHDFKLKFFPNDLCCVVQTPPYSAGTYCRQCSRIMWSCS